MKITIIGGTNIEISTREDDTDGYAIDIISEVLVNGTSVFTLRRSCKGLDFEDELRKEHNKDIMYIWFQLGRLVDSYRYRTGDSKKVSLEKWVMDNPDSLIQSICYSK